MNKYIFAIVLFITTFYVSAAEWGSPTELKYKERNEHLYAKYLEARDLLNDWRGQREYLVRADNLLKEILAEDNGYAIAYREYGRLFIMAGYINNDNFSKDSLNPSEASILEAIKIEPEYADAYVLLGHLYTNMKRYDEAEKALIKAENIGTNSPWLDLNWADLLQKLGKYKEAHDRYLNVVTKGTNNKKAYSSALAGVSKYYKKVGDYKNAKVWYLKQIEYEPRSAWNWGNYASFLLFNYGDTEGAITNAEKALAIMNYGMGRYILACALYTRWSEIKREGDLNNLAQKYFDKAYSLYPNVDEVIHATKKYSKTKHTSESLIKYKAKG